MRGVTDSITSELLFGIQVERDKSGDMYSGRYFGFTVMEEGMLVLLTDYISQKISELDQILNCHSKDQLLISTHEYFSHLLENRTVVELILAVRQNLPQYLGYELAGLLYFSNKSIVLS